MATHDNHNTYEQYQALADAKRTREQLFGTKTGKHTHPNTHPIWIVFTDGACLVCDHYAR